jgi:hypothetical protein
MTEHNDATELTDWVGKLKFTFSEEEDGSGLITIEWDHLDPDLDYWTSLGEEGQQKFIMDGLFKSCADLGITTDDT